MEMLLEKHPDETVFQVWDKRYIIKVVDAQGGILTKY